MFATHLAYPDLLNWKQVPIKGDCVTYEVTPYAGPTLELSLVPPAAIPRLRTDTPIGDGLPPANAMLRPGETYVIPLEAQKAYGSTLYVRLATDNYAKGASGPVLSSGTIPFTTHQSIASQLWSTAPVSSMLGNGAFCTLIIGHYRPGGRNNGTPADPLIIPAMYLWNGNSGGTDGLTSNASFTNGVFPNTAAVALLHPARLLGMAWAKRYSRARLMWQYALSGAANNLIANQGAATWYLYKVRSFQSFGSELIYLPFGTTGGANTYCHGEYSIGRPWDATATQQMSAALGSSYGSLLGLGTGKTGQISAYWVLDNGPPDVMGLLDYFLTDRPAIGALGGQYRTWWYPEAASKVPATFEASMFSSPGVATSVALIPYFGGALGNVTARQNSEEDPNTFASSLDAGVAGMGAGY